MEAIFDYYDIDTNDIWPFEAHHFLIGNRPDEQILHLKNILEAQIIKTRQEQKQLNKTVTILPFVTVADYDNNTNKDLWLEHVQDFEMAKCLRDHVRLDYFSFVDKRLDSCFFLKQDIIIPRINYYFDFWFALKLGQYKDGVKYISNFLNYQKSKNFELDSYAFCEFLEDVILQYKDEFIDEKVCARTEKWIVSQKIEISEKHESLKTKGMGNEKPEAKKYTGGYRTFLWKKAEFNLGYFNTSRNETALNELWNDLIQADLIKKSTINDLKAVFLNVPIKKENRIVWSKSIKSLIEFVKALINSKRIVELSGVDHWLITMDCFVLKSSKEIQFASLYKSDSKDSPLKAGIEVILKNFIVKLE